LSPSLKVSNKNTLLSAFAFWQFPNSEGKAKGTQKGATLFVLACQSHQIVNDILSCRIVVVYAFDIVLMVAIPSLFCPMFIVVAIEGSSIHGSLSTQSTSHQSIIANMNNNS
jgi:hypothetical protein